MNLAIKAVINSFDSSQPNEGYNNWRGSGDTLYTEEQKKNKEKEKNVPDYQDLKQKNEKIYARVKTVIDHFWEPVGKKYRRHSFRKITKENV